MIPDIFTPVRDLIARMRGEESQTEHAYNLSEGELAALRKFYDTDSWNASLKVVNTLVRQKSHQLMQKDVSDRELHYIRGFIAGAQQLPTSIGYALELEESKKDERNRLEQPESTGRSRNLATFGSAAWRRNGSD